MGGLLHLVQWGARGLGGTAATVLLYNGPLLCGFNLPINGFGLVTDVFKLCLKSYFSWFSSGLPTPTPLPPHGRIWDVMLVWRKGNIKKTVSVTALCANGAQRYEQFLQVGRLYRVLILLALALYLPSASISSVFMVLYYIVTKFWLHPFLTFSGLSLHGGIGLTIVIQWYDAVGS